MTRQIAWTCRPRWVAAALAAVAMTGCGSTTLVNSWADPNVGEITFQKVVAVCISKDPLTRRAAEDALVAQFRKAEATPSYTLIPDEKLGDDKHVLAQIAGAGFDGALTMRLLEKKEQKTWVAGSYPSDYHNYGDYHRGGFRSSGLSGQVKIDEISVVETHIYSLSNGKLVWAGSTETVNPTSVEETVQEIAAAAAKDLRKRGLIPPEDKGDGG